VRSSHMRKVTRARRSEEALVGRGTGSPCLEDPVNLIGLRERRCSSAYSGYPSRKAAEKLMLGRHHKGTAVVARRGAARRWSRNR